MNKPLSSESLSRLISEALAIEIEEAKEAGSLGFMARAMVQATLPHKNFPGNEFTRTNGAFTLSLMAPAKIGLPYGSIPRLLISWVTTEAVRTRERELTLGDSLSAFMRQLDLVPTGGRWGTVTRLKEQMARLFASSVTCTFDDGKAWALESVKLVDSARLWWIPKQPQQAAIWKSTITLGERFFQEIIENPVPIDMRALKALKRSPMALDIYCWLTHRMHYLKRSLIIPWEALQGQFGADYANTHQGRQGFRRGFQHALKKVLLMYSSAKVDALGQGLELQPSSPHIYTLLK